MTQAQDIFSDRGRWAAAQAKTVELRDSLAGKFNFSVVLDHPWTRLVAEQYAREFRGDFPYMVEMRERVDAGERLSNAQVAGVLNCAVNDFRRNVARPVGAAVLDLSKVKNARYRVVLADGTSIAIRLSDVDRKNGSDWARRQPEGTRNVSLLTQGADGWTGSGWITADGQLAGKARSGHVAEALKVLANADDLLTFGLAYARMGSQCFICGRALDTEASIEAGVGPVCAAKWGIPHGDITVPESVQAARAAQTATVENATSAEFDAASAEANEAAWYGEEPKPLADSKFRGHREGVFETTGSEIIRKGGEKLSVFEQATGRPLKADTYRPGRTYEEIFGDDD